MVVDQRDGGPAVSGGLEGAVRARLEEVIDPCSCFTEEPVNIVDLGLVESVSVDGGTVRVELLLTSQGCTYSPYIRRDIEQRVGALDGVEGVEVSEVTDRIWTRDRMDREVRRARRERFRARMEAAGITPHAEQGSE